MVRSRCLTGLQAWPSALAAMRPEPGRSRPLPPLRSLAGRGDDGDGGPRAPPAARSASAWCRADGGPEMSVPMSGETLTCGNAGGPHRSPMTRSSPRCRRASSSPAAAGHRGRRRRQRRLRPPAPERELPAGGELGWAASGSCSSPFHRAPGRRAARIAWGSPDPGYRLRVVQLLEGGMRGAAFRLKEGENLLGRESGRHHLPRRRLRLRAATPCSTPGASDSR